jgi:endonuclease/exonuclease/phosphatase family metal-dependent hydrolase
MALMRKQRPSLGGNRCFGLGVFAFYLCVLCLSATLPASTFAQETEAAPFRVASYNIHYILDGKIDLKGPANWEKRRDAVTHVLTSIDADIIAFQEMETFAGAKFNPQNVQLKWLLATMPGYRAAAVGDPSKFPSTQPILYRTSRFELLKQGWFYFSETPDKLFSPSFDGGFDHYASTAQFKDKASNLTVTLINVHTDIRSLTNRRGATRVISDRVKQLQARGERVIVLGDFNAISVEPNMQSFKKLSLESTNLTLPTFHFGVGVGAWFAIDHILHSQGIERLGKATIHRKSLNGVFPSDHFPISGVYRLLND